MAASSGFALGFLRRLLCAHTTVAAAPHDAPRQPEGRSAPCIVARLMGLDSVPAAEEARHARPQSRPASSPRAGRSLGEKPPYLRAENDMFLLLSFSPEERDSRNNERPGDGEQAGRRRESRPSKLQGSRPHRRKLRFGCDDEADSSSARRDCDAQQGSTSSPVSVLEARDESSTTTSSSSADAEPCSAASAAAEEEAHFPLEQQSSTRKQHTSPVQLDDMSPATSTALASTCSERDRRNRRMVNKSYVSAPDVTGIWKPICGLVEEDLRNVEWLPRDGANLVAEMDSDILDQLICEATVELVRLSSRAYPFSYPQRCSAKTSHRRRPCLQETLQLLEAPGRESRESSSSRVLHYEIGLPLI